MLYKTHTRFNIFIALPILCFGIYYFWHPKINFLMTFFFSFCYATLFMNPDVDISDKNKLFSIKGFLTFPFRIYSKIFKHRGLSHSIVFGTMTRILFLFILFLCLLFLLNKTISSKDFLSFSLGYKTYILFAISGIFLADMCHLLLDFK